LSKDRSKDILKEIRALREDLDARIGRLEAAVGLSGAEEAAVSQGASVHETEVSEIDARSIPDPVPRPEPVVAPVVASGGITAMPEVGSAGAPRGLSVVVRPLLDLGLARAVESTLGDSEGIENVRLTSLSGDSAVIDAQVSPGVSVLSALRRGLPVAFDVTDSTDNSVTIELARPEIQASEPETSVPEVER
jgi:hypothetical protein